ncbi:dTDP-glucose 4,6-dehydratase [Sphingomonas sp.]|uniref:dTDP-glucose 4,6-dehydratase n=1 Tax=Sphingomonas sp. TaxID=28214 RepID=UPI002CC3F0F7|nr:dTDP-glucose 4,6-dehydratase [Sphingomonas sp.]HWK35833.1 dTDP-glucose 4,6-dehydratase [Sphingomonas sp.]
MRTALVTGGAGFIGSALARHLVATGTRAVVLDALTYAASRESLASLADSPLYRFVQGDIADRALVGDLLAAERVDVVFHLAAETHVDRSIAGPAAFVQTNIVGTYQLLEAALDHWRRIGDGFRFHHVSTDEVHGDLPLEGAAAFNEESPYRPSSPYSASKAASDHLVAAWGRTYGLPATISSCSNNYGPWQSPDKLIPRIVANALSGKPLPVYGAGANVRDWLFVDDHARALDLIARRARPGARYAVGGRAERSNLQVVHALCGLLDRHAPRADGRSYLHQIQFVADRPGHDLRYAIDPGRIEGELGWRRALDFDAGLAATVAWYLANPAWWQGFDAAGHGLDALNAA